MSSAIRELPDFVSLLVVLGGVSHRWPPTLALLAGSAFQCRNDALLPRAPREIHRGRHAQHDIEILLHARI